MHKQYIAWIRIGILVVGLLVPILTAVHVALAQTATETATETARILDNRITDMREVQVILVAQQRIIEGRMSRIEAITDANNRLLIGICIGFAVMIGNSIIQLLTPRVRNAK